MPQSLPISIRLPALALLILCVWPAQSQANGHTAESLIAAGQRLQAAIIACNAQGLFYDQRSGTCVDRRGQYYVPGSSNPGVTLVRRTSSISSVAYRAAWQKCQEFGYSYRMPVNGCVAEKGAGTTAAERFATSEALQAANSVCRTVGQRFDRGQSLCVPAVGQ